MTDRFRHPSFILAVAFLLFWSVFALVYGIREARRTAGDYPGIAESGVLRVVGEEDLFSYHIEGDSCAGFYYLLFKAFADQHGLKLEYRSEPSLNRRIRMLEDDKCDVLSGPLPVVADLRDRIAYTRVIIDSKLMLIQRRNAWYNRANVMRNQTAFGGKRIHILDNPVHLERLHHLASEISDTIHIRKLTGYDSERLIAQVAAGLVDYAVCDMWVARTYRERYPAVDVETPVGFDQGQALGVKPGSTALLDSLNVFLSAYKKSPAFAKLSKQYLQP